MARALTGSVDIKAVRAPFYGRINILPGTFTKLSTFITYGSNPSKSLWLRLLKVLQNTQFLLCSG